MGRDTVEGQTLAVITRFNEAFNRHDVDAIMEAMTDDCVFDDIRPRPDGQLFEGQDAVRAYWERFSSAPPTPGSRPRRPLRQATAAWSDGSTTG